MKQYLTKDGLEKIKKELDQLKNVERRKLAELLKHAIAQGDLSENFAYSEAKDKQGFLEGRIRVLEEIIRTAVLISEEKANTVQLGTTVTLQQGKNNLVFKVVGPIEANIMEGKISSESPLGKLLMKKGVGETVSLETSDGITKYKIVKIE